MWPRRWLCWLLQRARLERRALPASPAIASGFALTPQVAHCLQPLALAGCDSSALLMGESSDRISLRQRQFEAGRRCAAGLLASMGSGDTRVGVHADRSPAWPAGYVGSISHTDMLLGVAVARASVLRGIGIDIEGIVSVQAAREIERMCLNQHELRRRRGLGLDRCAYAVLCFSAKEALYKCLYPLVQRYFDFHAAEIIGICPRTGTLRLRLLQDLSDEFQAGNVLVGCYRWDGAHVFTSFELPPTQVTRV